MYNNKNIYPSFHINNSQDTKKNTLMAPRWLLCVVCEKDYDRAEVTSSVSSESPWDTASAEKIAT